MIWVPATKIMKKRESFSKKLYNIFEEGKLPE